MQKLFDNFNFDFTIDPPLAFLGGAIVMAAVVFPLILSYSRRLALAERISQDSENEAELAREILAAAPDGLFIWDLRSGGPIAREYCSRRLAVLLDLEQGTNSEFRDVLRRFNKETAGLLNKAVNELRRHGTAFDLLLPFGTRQIQAIGVRANTEEGRTVSDIMWMREAVSGESRGASSGRDAGSAIIDPSVQAVLDQLPLPAWLRDTDLKLTFVNRAGAGKKIAEPARELAAQAVLEGRTISESRLFSDGPEPRMMQVTETPLDGFNVSLGFAVDQSDKETIEGRHAQQSAAQDEVLQSLSTAIAIFDVHRNLSFFNGAYATLWKLEASWLSSKPDLGAVLDRLRERRRLPEVADFKSYRDQLTGLFGTLAEPMESLLHLPDGTSLRSVVSPHPLGGLLFAYEDVTDRLALERSYNTLNAVQRETLNNLHEGIAVFGSDGRLQLFNPVLSHLWRIDEARLRDSLHLSDFVEVMQPLLIAIDDWPAHKQKVIARMLARESSSGRLLRGDGRVVDYANVPLPDGAVLLTYLDVTDSVRVELALRERAEALQVANRLKSEFIANVSHEVRTPLTTVIGFAEILAEEYFGPLNTRQREYSEGIRDTSRQLMTVISDILDLASIEAGIMTLELTSVDLHSLLAGVLGLVRERARNLSMKMRFDCPPDIGWIIADEKRLKQVVFNLLSNALESTPPRGMIALEARRETGGVAILVSDTGPGIPIDQQLRLTGPAGQSAEPILDGSGMGLSLVSRFVELHGGKVEIKSAPGKGATVVLHMPVDAAAEDTGTKTTAAQ